jgi:hypothetical protein
MAVITPSPRIGKYAGPAPALPSPKRAAGKRKPRKLPAPKAGMISMRQLGLINR